MPARVAGSTVAAGSEVVAQLSPAVDDAWVILTLSPERVLTASGINFQPGSSAEAAGLSPGETILEMGGVDVGNAQIFLDNYLLQVKLAPDTVVPLKVDRDGSVRTIQLATGVDPTDGSGEPGLSFAWEENEPAVIDTVNPGDPADAAGLLSGDRIVAAVQD